MERRSAILALVLSTVLMVSACGEDNNDNRGPGEASTPTVTPVLTATPTPVEAGTLTPTPTGAVTPVATSTPAGGACEADQLEFTITSAAGSDLDTGWTGIAHNSVAVEQSTVKVDLNDCADDGECTVDGSALVGTTFGSPLPLSSGGVPVCVTNTFREAVTGTYNCETGCGSSETRLNSAVFLVQDIAKPCPLCVGDPTPNDGVKGGTCDGGAAPNAPCDVGGISPTFGATSNDCQPSGSPVSVLQINLSPLTTGTVSQEPGLPCVAVGSIGLCYCEGQNRPNACDSGVCPPSGLCEGPIEGLCTVQSFRSCITDNDCGGTYPGAGTCRDSPRPCFGQSVTRTGQCGVGSGTLVSLFCIPRTAAPAINTTAGLPGLGALSLPATTVRRPR